MLIFFYLVLKNKLIIVNFEIYISKRIISKSKSNGISGSIVKIAIISVTLGLVVMITSVSIITGFKKAIREKVIGFSSHIQISNYDSNISLELKPIEKNTILYNSIKKSKVVNHIQAFALKGGLIKTDSDIHGVVVKGIDSDYDWKYFKDKIIEGTYFTVTPNSKSDKILVSKQIANKLKLKLNEKIRVYFISNELRVYPFTICGIYETGLDDIDKEFVITDIAYIQKLNNWNEKQIGGIEVFINDYDKLENVKQEINQNINYNMEAKSIKDLYPQIFDWLELQNINVQIILILMVLVAGINMVSALLILILERTNMIGILKALGASNISIRKVFLYNATYIILNGLFWGNLIGLGICLIQKQFGIASLPQESYYITKVPINLDLFYILLLNVGTLLTCLIMLILPTFVITFITPIKAIRYN